MRKPARTRLRRDPRVRHALPFKRALDILELLVASPAGLTIIEIASRLKFPAEEVVRTIAVMQRRQWLRMDSHRGGVVPGPRLADLNCGAQRGA